MGKRVAWIAVFFILMTMSAVSVAAVKPAPEAAIEIGNPYELVAYDGEPSSELLSAVESSSTTVKYDDSWYVNQGTDTDGVVWGGYDMEVYADDVNTQADCICFDWCDDGSSDNKFSNWDNCYCKSNQKLNDCRSYSSWVNTICNRNDCSVIPLESHHAIGTGSSGDKWTCGVDIREYRDCDNSAGQQNIYNWAGQGGRAYWVVYGHQYDCDEQPGPDTNPDYEGDFDSLWVNIKSNTGMCSWSEECDENHDEIISYTSWANPSNPCRTKNWEDCSYGSQCVSDKCDPWEGVCSPCLNSQCTSDYWEICVDNGDLCCSGDPVFGQYFCDYDNSWSKCTDSVHTPCQHKDGYYCTEEYGIWAWRECPLGCSGGSCTEPCGELHDGQILYNSVTLDPECEYYLPNGIDIWADDVTLDCRGATIKGANVRNRFAVEAYFVWNLVVKNCKFTDYDPDVPIGGPDYGAAIWLTDVDGATIKNNEINNVMIAININGTGSDNVLIEGNTIHGGRENAIYARVRNSVIRNNTIDQVTELNPLHLEGPNKIIEANLFRDSPPSLGSDTENIIESNLSRDSLSRLISDSENAIYVRIRDPVIRNNFLSQVTEWSSLHLEGPNNVIEGNLFGDSLSLGSGTENTTVRNNIIEEHVYNAGQGTKLLGNTFLDSNVWDDGIGTVYCDNGVGNEWRASPNVTLYTSLSIINNLTLDTSCAWELPFGILLRGEGAMLDCQGATLAGILGEWDAETTWGTNGIEIWTDDVVIKNCLIEGYATGIATWRTKDHLIENNNITVPVIPNPECPDEKIVGRCPIWGFPRPFAAYDWDSEYTGEEGFGNGVNDSVFRNNIFNNSYDKSFHMDGHRNVIEDNLFIGHFGCYDGGENSFLGNQFLVGTGEPSVWFYASQIREDCGNNVFRDNVVDTRDAQKDFEVIGFSSSWNTFVGNTFHDVDVFAYAEDNIWCEAGKGNLYLHGATYNGPDPNGGTCEPVGDLKVLEVLPIQTVRDVPLIQGKSGLIRTTLYWDSAEPGSIEATLTYSLVPVPSGDPISLGPPQEVTVPPNEEKPFLFDFTPTVYVGEYNVTVEAFTFHSESDYTNNVNQTTVEVIDTKPVWITYVGVDYDFSDSFQVEEYLNGSFTQHNYLWRTYPLAYEEALRFTIPIPYSLSTTEELLIAIPLGLSKSLGIVSIMKNVQKKGLEFGPIGATRVVGLYPDNPHIGPGYGILLSTTHAPIAQVDLIHGTAHEMGHTYGLCDEYAQVPWERANASLSPVGCPNGDNNFDGLLDPICDWEGGCQDTTLVGLVPWYDTSFPYPPEHLLPTSENVLFNFMGSTNNPGDRWVDKATYLHLIDQFHSPTVQNVSERLLIAGLIFKNGSELSIELDPIELLGPGEVVEGDVIPGNMSLELLDLSGDLLSSLDFRPSFSISAIGGEYIETNVSSFVFVIERPPAVESIRFVEEEEIVEERQASENAPTVRIISPSGETAYKEEVLIEWEASDEDGDPLVYAVGVSSDGGESWHSLVADYSETSVVFDIDKTLFNPSASFLIRVRAMDGFLSTEDIMNVSFELNPECVDSDGDDVCDDTDNCVNDPNPLQLDFEDDDIGDVCDPDDDNDGVLDVDDLCLFSVLPELVPTDSLEPNHYADMDGDGVFETMQPKGKNKAIVDSDYALADTYGCSCAEILEVKPGKNKGEFKYGCTEDTMDEFIAGADWVPEEFRGSGGASFLTTWVTRILGMFS